MVDAPRAPFGRTLCAAGAIAVAAACRSSDPRPTAASAEPDMRSSPAASATDGRLELALTIDGSAVVDRVPMRTARLAFHNVSPDPLRVYLPEGEAFRANISTLFFASTVDRNASFAEPEPRPHGYAVTEADFHLIAPGETVRFTQRFTLDPFAPGPGLRAERRPGFPPGSAAVVRWTYQNSIRSWPGGVATLDGPTRALFDGGEIPGIWTGKLSLETRWTVP